MINDDPSHNFLIPTEDRINFYLNGQESFEIDLEEFHEVKNSNYWNKRELHLVSYNQYKNTFLHWYCKNLVQKPVIRDIRALPFYQKYRYLHSLMNFFVPFDNQEMGCKDVKYPLFYGEGGATGTIPALRKTRPMEDRTSVIFNIGTLRHTLPCETVRKVDIPWSEKSHNVVWRGATTGGQLRVNLVESYGKKYDIGFASVKQKPELAHLKKSKISIKDQLKYKFIISIAGNELASNLRWTLFSNSVPIMPKPKWHSWIMEKNLKPNVHYLELNPDLTNLEEILEWAREHDEECNQIAQNGKKYMEQFLDPKKDLPVQKLLLEEYAKRLTYTNN